MRPFLGFHVSFRERRLFESHSLHQASQPQKLSKAENELEQPGPKLLCYIGIYIGVK